MITINNDKYFSAHFLPGLCDFTFEMHWIGSQSFIVHQEQKNPSELDIVPLYCCSCDMDAAVLFNFK